jgi:hypothetical protein
MNDTLPPSAPLTPPSGREVNPSISLSEGDVTQ